MATWHAGCLWITLQCRSSNKGEKETHKQTPRRWFGGRGVLDGTGFPIKWTHLFFLDGRRWFCLMDSLNPIRAPLFEFVSSVSSFLHPSNPLRGGRWVQSSLHSETNWIPLLDGGVGNLMTMHVFKFIASVVGPSLLLRPFDRLLFQRFQSERFRLPASPDLLLPHNLVFFSSSLTRSSSRWRTKREL